MFILCAVQPGAIRRIQGGHKPGKHGKPGNLREFEKLSKSQGKLMEIWTFVEKTWKTQGKWKLYVTWSPTKMHSLSFSLLSCSGKSLKYPEKLRENSGNLVSQKMWSSFHNFNLKLIIKAVQICDPSEITHMIRCAWNASSMYPAFRIVPQLHSDTVL